MTQAETYIYEVYDMYTRTAYEYTRTAYEYPKGVPWHLFVEV